MTQRLRRSQWIQPATPSPAKPKQGLKPLWMRAGTRVTGPCRRPAPAESPERSRNRFGPSAISSSRNDGGLKAATERSVIERREPLRPLRFATGCIPADPQHPGCDGQLRGAAGGALPNPQPAAILLGGHAERVSFLHLCVCLFVCLCRNTTAAKEEEGEKAIVPVCVRETVDSYNGFQRRKLRAVLKNCSRPVINPLMDRASVQHGNT